MESVLLHGLHNDKVLFNSVIGVFMLSSEVRTNDVMATFSDFKKLFELKSATRDEFLKRSRIKTDNCLKVNALLADPDKCCMYFGENST